MADRSASPIILMTYTFNARKYEMVEAVNGTYWFNIYQWTNNHYSFIEAHRVWGSLEEAKSEAKHLIIVDLKARNELA